MKTKKENKGGPCEGCAVAIINGRRCHEFGCHIRRREIEEAKREEMETTEAES